MVTAITTATNTAGTPITVARDPFAIAITPDGKTAYVANQVSGTVTPIAIAAPRWSSSSRASARARPGCCASAPALDLLLGRTWSWC